MKKYRLKQWYPSLPNGVEVGHIIEFDGKANSSKYGVIELYSLQEEPKMWISSKELHPDFWELIEEEKPKPLFITEDGVEFTFISQKFYVVNKQNFRKEMCPVLSDDVVENWLVFYHEANADKYIWRNKPVFSYEDFIRWGNVPYQRVIEQLAKERSEQ